MKERIAVGLMLTLSVLVSVACLHLGIGQFYALDADVHLSKTTAASQANLVLAEDDLVDLSGLTKWDDLNPDSLLLIAAHKAMIAAQDNTSFNDAIRTVRKAQWLRPMQAKAYLMEAEYQWRNHASFERILRPLQQAQRNAPFDRAVALLSLEFYLAHWEHLELEQRVMLSKYLLEPSRFRMPYSMMNQVIARSPGKSRACNLLAFNQVKLRACRG